LPSSRPTSSGCLDGAIDPPITGADLATGVELPCDLTEQRLRLLSDRFQAAPTASVVYLTLDFQLFMRMARNLHKLLE